MGTASAVLLVLIVMIVFLGRYAWKLLVKSEVWKVLPGFVALWLSSNDAFLDSIPEGYATAYESGGEPEKSDENEGRKGGKFISLGLSYKGFRFVDAKKVEAHVNDQLQKEKKPAIKVWDYIDWSLHSIGERKKSSMKAGQRYCSTLTRKTISAAKCARIG